MVKKKTSQAERRDQQLAPDSTPTAKPPRTPADGGSGGEADASVTTAGAGADITEDSEFKDLLPRPSAEEQAALEASLKAEGCRDALTFWKDEKGRNLLLDGYTRRPLCLKHGIPFKTVPVLLRDRDEAKLWILNNQFSRRNMTPDTASYLRGRVYNALKQPHGGSRKASGSKAQNEHSNRTAAVLEKRFGVSSSTIRRDGQFAEAVDRIAKVCGEDTRRTILSGKHSLSLEDVRELAGLEADSMKQKLEQCLTEGRKPHKTKEKTGQAEPVSDAPVVEARMASAGEVPRGVGKSTPAPVKGGDKGIPTGKPTDEGGTSDVTTDALKGKGHDAGLSKQLREAPVSPSQAGTTDTTAPAKSNQLILPNDPPQLAAALMEQLGRKGAEAVHQALGKLLGKATSEEPTGPDVHPERNEEGRDRNGMTGRKQPHTTDAEGTS